MDKWWEFFCNVPKISQIIGRFWQKGQTICGVFRVFPVKHLSSHILSLCVPRSLCPSQRFFINQLSFLQKSKIQTWIFHPQWIVLLMYVFLLKVSLFLSLHYKFIELLNGHVLSTIFCFDFSLALLPCFLVQSRALFSV